MLIELTKTNQTHTQKFNYSKTITVL